MKPNWSICRTQATVNVKLCAIETFDQNSVMMIVTTKTPKSELLFETTLRLGTSPAFA